MSAVIRRATPRDAAAIAAIIMEAFGDRIEADAAHIAQVLNQHDNFIAECGDRVVGFVGNFVTRSASGRLRYELDLLAVALDARGGGIGAQLVDASIDAALSANAHVVRTLVASRNSAMQRLCRTRRFTRDPIRYVLYVAGAQVWRGAAERQGTVDASEAHLIPVETLTYSGIWLEGRISQSSIDEANRRAYGRGMSRIGAVLPRNDEAAAQLLAANRFDRVDDYDWWTFKLGSGLS